MKLVMTNRDTTEQGAASIIVVIFMSIILSILTIGFVRLALDEQRQAVDDSLSARAFYAAESGLEDGKRAIGEYLRSGQTASDLAALNTDTCDAPAGYDNVLSTPDDFDAEYTCQLIDLRPSVYRTQFTAPNQTKQLRFNPVTEDGSPAVFDQMRVRWHVNAEEANNGNGLLTGSGGSVDLRSAGETSLPPVSAWDYPAMLQYRIISNPNVGTFTSAQINSTQNYLSPNDSGSGTVPNIFGVDAEVLDGRCDPAASIDSYVCEIDITFLSGISRDRTLRLTNLYAATNVEISIFDGGVQRFFEDTQAVIDVTARSGEVFRRVEAVIDLSEPDVLPDFTIQSATDICKDFSITDDASEFGGVPGTSCRN